MRHKPLFLAPDYWNGIRGIYICYCTAMVGVSEEPQEKASRVRISSQSDTIATNALSSPEVKDDDGGYGGTNGHRSDRGRMHTGRDSIGSGSVCEIRTFIRIYLYVSYGFICFFLG